MLRRVATAIASYIGFGPEDDLVAPTHVVPVAPPQSSPQPQVHPVVAPAPMPRQHKWQRHTQLRAYTPPITPDVREARRCAVRGIYAVREGATEVALDHFIQAARCREVDLTAVPGFWELTRGQMMVAVDAYERVERYREAASLDAQISTIFRPQLVGEDSPIVLPKRVRLSGD